MNRQLIPVTEAFAEWRKDPEYVAAYDALEAEFVRAAARTKAGSNDGAVDDGEAGTP
ncbi:MAG: hypothetical protein KIT76_01070 [Pseudolabrys sp.]|nr:hypothetical protein [Pseudolabrys sp.]MCW5696148.1 hypothetical protein [Bauldia sp.]